MNNLHIKIPHKLDPEQVLTRVKELSAGMRQQYKEKIKDVSEQWDGHEGKFQFAMKGFVFAGVIYVGVDTVRISSRLPFLLSLYRGKISQAILNKGTALLAEPVTA